MRPPSAQLSSSTPPLSFAAANAFAKALYLRGCTLVSVFLVRCLVVYLWNGALTAVREGCTTSCRVLTLRTGKLASNRMATVRGLVGAMTGIGLNLSFVFLTFADGFTVFKGCALLGSAVGAGFLGERLNWRELCIFGDCPPASASSSSRSRRSSLAPPRTAARWQRGARESAPPASAPPPSAASATPASRC